MGAFSKDKGVLTSRIGQIVRQAEKVPGPGKYLGVADLKEERNKPAEVYSFSKMTRSQKLVNKVPAPHHYERKDILTSKSIASQEHLSHIPRLTQGRIAKGPKRSFLDQAERHSSGVPAPGAVNFTNKSRNKLDGHQFAPNLGEAKRSRSSAPAAKELGPSDYRPNHTWTEVGTTKYTIPKETGNSFVDKAVQGAYADRRGKTPTPGPGTHNWHLGAINKVTRGTKLCQLRGLGRSACSGYF